ncbi:MAG: methyltransferase domain-containing protein [Candidatus Heimdallarchaeaceae archaeon]
MKLLKMEGNPSIEVSLSNNLPVEGLSKLIACYIGYKEGKGGYFIPIAGNETPGIEKVISCPVCGSKQNKDLHAYKNGVVSGICLKCGHIYLTKRYTKHFKRYKDFSQSYPDSYLKNESNLIFEIAKNRRNFIESNVSIPIKSIMEIGCGYGHFLSLYDNSCFKVGIEPSHKEASFARKHFEINEVWECSYEDLPEISPTWPKEGFDLICSFHTLEHLDNPLDFLRFAKRRLKKGGYLCLAVPNLFSLSPDLIEAHFLFQSLHLHTFTSETLSLLLAKERFKVIKIEKEEPTLMLRSSFIVISQITSLAQKPNFSKEYVRKAINGSLYFYQSLNKRIQKIKSYFKKWLDEGKKIAIYGGGLHTKSLLELLDISYDNIVLIIDDDPKKQNKVINGIPIYSFAEAMRFKIDIILISSLASEQSLLKRICVPENIKVFGIYKDIIGDKSG